MDILEKLEDIKNDLDNATSWGDVERVGARLAKLIDELS